MKDKISVITTYYNTGNRIIDCLNSVMFQIAYSKDYDVEYVIVNDCSTDDTSTYVNVFLDLFKKQNPKQYNAIDVKHIQTKQNLGRGGARKFGIKQSTGNYLMFLDSDDRYLHSDLLLRAYSMITSIDADMCEFGIKYIDKDCNAHDMYIAKPYTLYNKGVGNLMYLFYEDHIKFMPWTKIIKRSLVETYEYNEAREYDDILTIPYWVYNANKIIIAPWIEVLYHPSKTSITTKNMNETRYGTVKAISSLFEDFKNEKCVLKAMYDRCLVDLKTILNSNSEDEYFNKMSKLNTKMLSYIYPDKYKNMTADDLF